MILLFYFRDQRAEESRERAELSIQIVRSNANQKRNIGMVIWSYSHSSPLAAVSSQRQSAAVTAESAV